jgi:hypothetical protein
MKGNQMTSLDPRRINQGGLLAASLVALSLLVWVLAFVAPTAARHSREHSVKQWGSTVTGSVVHQDPIQSSDGGPLRAVSISFPGKFGETQTVTVPFFLSQRPTYPKVWQRKDTGQIFVTHQIKDGTSFSPSDTKATPYYSGDNTQLGFDVLGVLIGVGAWIVIACVGWFISDVIRYKQRNRRIYGVKSAA